MHHNLWRCPLALPLLASLAASVCTACNAHCLLAHAQTLGAIGGPKWVGMSYYDLRTECKCGTPENWAQLSPRPAWRVVSQIRVRTCLSSVALARLQSRATLDRIHSSSSTRSSLCATPGRGRDRPLRLGIRSGSYYVMTNAHPSTAPYCCESQTTAGPSALRREDHLAWPRCVYSPCPSLRTPP